MKKSMAGALFVLALLWSGFASAQAYPNKPIRFIIGFPPGTIIDTVARPLAEEMSKKLGQPIIIEFKPGANSTIGAKFVVNAEPDGYTLFFGTSSTIHPLLNKNNGVDAGKDMASVAAVASAPFFVLSRASLPVTSLKELTAWGKANPDRLSHAAPSATANLIMKMIEARTGVSSRGIPYKSSAQASLALLSGEVDLGAATVLSFLPHIQAGKLRALFVLAPKRSGLLPDVPTAAELGVANLEMATNIGLWAPPGTPAAVIQRISSEVAAALAVPAIAENIRKGAGADPVGSTPEGQLRIFEAESKSWAEAARLANFTAP